jgi:hypothetical protein
MTTLHRRPTAALALVLAAVAWSCGGHPGAAFVSSGSTVEATSTTVELALRLTDADNGRSITAAVGSLITVVLPSTYWHVMPPTDTNVLAMHGQPEVTAGGPGCPSIPGTGCGTVLVTFAALAAGSADVVANRSSCGEALRCTGDQGQWRVHIEVGGPPPTSARATTVPAVTPTTAKASSAAGVEGTVRFSPVCPVERVPPDPQCSPRPGTALIRLVPVANGVPVSGQAGADGRFSIPAVPGTYSVEAVATSAGPGRGCQVSPAQVAVVAGSFSPVTVTCDTGIR